MSEEPGPDRRELTPKLSAVLRRLESFAPAPLRIERDRLMFEAGRAAERGQGTRAIGSANVAEVIPVTGFASDPLARANRFWRATASVMTAASIVLATMLVWQRPTTPIAQPAAAGSNQPATHAAATIDADRDNLTQLASGQQAVPRSSSGYLNLRYVTLTRGAGAIDSTAARSDSSADSTPPATARELLEEMLPTARQRS